MPFTARTILLVDDDPDILEAIRELLEMTFPDATILTASGGEEALALVRKHRPGVIVSDYRMPGMDGVEFLRRSREIVPAATRLMMSAYADADVATAAVRDADVALLVTKPFQLEYFVRLIGTLLDRRGAPPTGPS